MKTPKRLNLFIQIPITVFIVGFSAWFLIEAIFNQPSYPDHIRSMADTIAILFLILSLIGLFSLLICMPLYVYFKKKTINNVRRIQ